MSTIYWDTMLFIYILENHPVFAPRVTEIYTRMRARGDVLCTSFLSLGEILAGSQDAPDKSRAIRAAFSRLKVELLPFDEGSVDTFASLRAIQKLATADSIHLACAASRGVDLFITGDKRLTRQLVPGIRFIADFETSPL